MKSVDLTTAADQDLEVRWEGRGGGVGFVLLAPVAFLPLVISSFFAQNRGAGGGGSPGPSPRSANITSCYRSHLDTFKRRDPMSQIWPYFLSKEIMVDLEV